MFNAIVFNFSGQGLAFQLIFLAWPRLPRTSTELRQGIGSYSGKFILGMRAVFGLGLLYNRPGVDPTTSNNLHFQPPSSRFTSLRHQARNKAGI